MKKIVWSSVLIGGVAGIVAYTITAINTEVSVTPKSIITGIK